MNETDIANVDCYQKYGVPADQIAVNEEKRNEFAALVNSALKKASVPKIDPEWCAARAIHLRKRGFLPRLKRKKPK